MSDQACKNGCVTPLRFPRRPGENLPVVHADGCFCCDDNTLVSSDNRPALPHFNYRIGSYGTIREWLFHQINQTPTLKNWTHRAPDDPAIALLEGASILGDILTFYQETYANEAFLRTAQWRESISDLVRLLGYRLSPALGGNSTFAFEIKKDEPVVIPAGFPLKATLETPPKPSDFETKEEITAYPWLSRFNLFLPLVQKDIEQSTVEFYISKPEQLLSPVDLKAGDRLLMGEPVDYESLSDADKRAFDAPEPNSVQIQAATAAKELMLKVVEDALISANTTLLAGESSIAAHEKLIEMAEKAAETAAGDAKMQSVNAAISKLATESDPAWQTADAYFSSSQQNGDTIVEEVGEVTNSAANQLLASDVDAADIQNLLATLEDETDAIKAAINPVVGKAHEGEVMSRRALSQIGDALTIGNVLDAAIKATASEKASFLADKVAIEAANKAVRLAAIAASSAAAGASDRVAASALAREADRLAGLTVTEVSQVKPAIITLNNEAVRVSSSAGFDAVLAALTGGLSLVFTAATVPARLAAWVNAYNRALNEADEGKTASDNTKLKTSEVVGSLSDSATEAARQSITDRQAAINALTEAELLAIGGTRTNGTIVVGAKKAAETMVDDRAALIKAINDAIPLAAAAKGHLLESIDALHVLIAQIKSINFEDIGEAIMPFGGVKDDVANPARLKNAEIVIVDSIRELHGLKIFRIKGELKRTSPISALAAFKLGRSFHHFGHNGPPTTTKTDEPTKSTATTEKKNGKTTTTVTNPPIKERSIAFSRLLGDITRKDTKAIGLPGNKNAIRIIDPPLGKFEVPLDAEFPNIAAGVTFIIAATLFGSANTSKHGEFTMVRKVKQIKSAEMTWGLMTGSTSMITFDKQLTVSENGVRYRIADIRDFMLYETVSPLLTVKRAKEETTDSQGNTLNFYGTAEEVKTLKDRRIMLEKSDTDPYLRSISQVPALFLLATSKYKQLRSITLSDSVRYADFPNENPVTTVFGNLADADEGKTQPEVALGSGDATLVFQNLKIPKPPLTYHIVPENTPPGTPEAEIYVDGRMWNKVDSFFDRGGDEQIYIVREDADGNSWVQFGDGKSGARLTTGVKNVTAIYRTGSGAFGPLKDDTKVQASARIKNLDKIQMPSVATGGCEPEDGENARSAAPGKVQSLGRLVSLKDFESEALAIPGVASASASWSLVENIPAVVVRVLMETGRSGEIEAVADTLRAYNTSRGAGRFSVHAELGKRRYVTAAIQYALKTGYRADLIEPEIRRALGVNFALATGEEDQTGLFSLRRRRFGVREYPSTIEGVTQNVEGVLWAKATAFMRLTDESDIPYIDDPDDLDLPSATKLDTIVPCGSGFILSLYDKHLFLTAVSGGDAT